MRQLITASQALELDQKTQNIGDISAESLMERAGSQSAHWILRDYPQAQRFIIALGPGNNGGDGLVIARRLVDRKKHLTLLCPTRGQSELWLKQYDRLPVRAINKYIKFIFGDGIDKFLRSNKDQSWDVFIDAAFGVGLTRSLDKVWLETFTFCSQRSQNSVAIDVPSGLNATTGRAFNGTPRVDRTYTMGLAKLGLVVGDGPSFCGKIRIIEVGFSKACQLDLSPRIFFYDRKQALRDLPPLDAWTSNKSDRGHLLVIGGSVGMEGAGALAALAGARVGAGYVTWARWPTEKSHAVAVPPIILSAELDADLNFLQGIKKISAIVIGPGLGKTSESRRLVGNIYRKFYAEPVVVDADALDLFKTENLYPFPNSWILTPHTGELSRLLAIDVSIINKNRLDSIVAASKRLGGCLLLKGYRSLAVGPEGQIVVIGAGGPVLAKAGTGDILAGMIGGLLARGIPPYRALCLAAYLHGRTGDLYRYLWENDFTLVATDLLEFLPETIRRLRERSKSSEH